MINLDNKSTLIVDDSRAMRDILRVHLSNLGIAKVRMVERISDALREVRERTFDIILCDYHLSDGRTGQQFLEELRIRKLIKHSNVFIMVTSEQQYQSVIAVAEYAPDDYLIKPFVSTALEQRIVNAFEKKIALKAIFDAMDAEDYRKAFDQCQQYLLSGEKKYAKYVERLRAEACLKAENYEYAAHYYEDILQERQVAWAELGLGKSLHHLGEFERATELLKHVCKTHPMYLEGYDSLAKVHEAAGDDQDAEAIVDQAIEKSPMRLDRHAKLGEIAIRTGNLEKAEKAFNKIVTEGVGSCFHAPDAYFRLAEIHVAKGDTKKASEVLSKMGNHFEDSPDAAFCAAVAELGVAKENGDDAKVKQAFERANKIRNDNPNLNLPEAVLLRYACESLELGLDDEASSILRNIFQNNSRPDAVRKAAESYVCGAEASAKLQVLLMEFNQEIEHLNEQSQELARQQQWDEAVKMASEAVNRLKNNVDVLLSAAQINLMRMERKGWDEIRFPTIRKYMERARALNPKHPKLAAIEMMIERVKKKYGIQLEQKRAPYVPGTKKVAAPVAKSEVQAAYQTGNDVDEINLDELL